MGTQPTQAPKWAFSSLNLMGCFSQIPSSSNRNVLRDVRGPGGQVRPTEHSGLLLIQTDAGPSRGCVGFLSPVVLEEFGIRQLLSSVAGKVLTTDNGQKVKFCPQH